MPDEQDFKPNENEANHYHALEVDREPSTNDGPSETRGAVDGTPVTATPRSHKKRNGLIALAVLLLVAAGMAGAYFMMNQPDEKAQTTAVVQEKKTEAAPDTTVAEALVREIGADTSGSFSTGSGLAPVYKPEGYDYSVRSSVEYDFKFTGIKDKATNVLEAIRSKLEKQGYSEKVTQTLDGGAMFEANFTGTYALCYVYMIPGADERDAKASSAGMACSDIETYGPEAQKMKPFVDAYIESEKPEGAESMLYTGLKLKKSSVAGYSTAELGVGSVEGVGGFAALFYRTSDSSEWKFFKGTQNTLACKEYDTIDLKKAYLGTECFDENDTLTTVKL